MEAEIDEDCMDEESKGSSLEEDGGVVVNQTTAQVVQQPRIVVQQQTPIMQTTTVAAVHHSVGGIVTETKPEQIPATKGIAKLVVANHPSVTSCGLGLQKVVNPPLITVLNPTGPLTVVKSLCVTSGVSSAPQFTLVNSVTNAAMGKSPTITLLNAPVTVVKAITTAQPVTEGVEKNGAEPANLNSTVTSVPAIIENRGHNVFVKNTCSDTSPVPEMPQSHKLLTATNFPQTNVLTSLNTQQKTVNGQRSKLKILSNVVVPGTSHLSNNVMVSKPTTVTSLAAGPAQSIVPIPAPPQPLQQRYMPRPKMIGPNGAPQAKYLNKSGSNINPIKNPSSPNPTTLKLVQERSSTRMVYPTHKGQIKTIPPVNNYIQKNQQGIKTLSPQHKGIPAQIQRTGTGLRTIPPQRPAKAASSSTAKPNYIGKHAVQAHKASGCRPQHAPHHHHQSHKLKTVGGQQPTGATSSAGPMPLNAYGSPPPPGDKPHIAEMTFNQALTAQIIETLSSGSGSAGAGGGISGGGPLSGNAQNHYEIMPTRYHNAFSCPEPKQISELHKPMEDKNKSGLDALSLICQAVLLDHNYNATLPPESPTRPSPPVNMTSQVNGLSTTSVYSAGNVKRRPLVSSNSSTANISTLSSIACGGGATNVNLSTKNPTEIDDDDAGSDISDGSDRKHDTEGEETDTAPEAEAVNNDNFDGYGDYVTRCICGYLHDDGYMVECDRCKVWQHVQCVVKNRQVPDEYLCEVCDPRKPIDRQRARTVQQQWLRERHLIVAAQQQQQQSVLGVHQQGEAIGGVGGGAVGKRKEKGVTKETKTTAAAVKETVSDTDSSDAEHPVHNNHPSKSRLQNKRKDNKEIKNSARQRREVAKEAAQRRQKRKDRKIVRKKVCKTKAQAKSHSDDENQDTWSSQLPQLRQWIEKYEEAVTNHYSPELRARISSLRVNGAHQELTQVFDPTVHKCRVHAQPPSEVRYLVATAHLPPDTPVIELRGKYMLSTQHRNAGGSLNTRQHSQRPGPFLFFYRLSKDNTEVCVDTRTYGNSARFIRRSCKPNAELRHCIDKGVLHLYIVSTEIVEKNCELTIKHESHDLAAIGTSQIPCACGNAEECTVNKGTVKKNGEVTEVHSRKRRGRRTVSSNNAHEPETAKQLKQEPPPTPSPSAPAVASKPRTPSPVKLVKQEIVDPPPPAVTVKHEPTVDTKREEREDSEIEVKKEEVKEEIEFKQELVDASPAPPVEFKKEAEVADVPEVKKEKAKEEVKSPLPPPITTRRSSQYKSDKEDEKSDTKEEKMKSKKLSREERKLEAILRAIEQMEKAESRKQEHKEKQAHRRESEPGPTTPKEEDKQQEGPKAKRRRRKGRARTVSQSARRNRLNSTDSYMTSGDENMLSPNDDHQQPEKPHMDNPDRNDNRAVGLLLALSNGDVTSKHEKSPPREMDSNSNSAHSSPETQLSSACLLVQAAVEPLEPGFKFPKTKKGLMNEWLNKTPEPVQSASSISPSSLMPHINNNSDDATGFYTPNKNLAALAQAATYCDNTPTRGSAKKRWLRQAISEDHCDSPSSRPDSPPISDTVAPPKKRRLPRESLSNDASPPSTPTDVTTSVNDRPEGHVEIVYSAADGDSPTQTLESDAVLKERAAKMKQEFSMIQSLSDTPSSIRQPPTGLGCLMDPRLTREGSMFSGADLVGTVEKTLSILGFENEKQEQKDTTPKRKVKLSITEYRQRKQLTTNDRSGEHEHEQEQASMEENNSSESFRQSTTPIPRSRTGSTSSSTSLTSSDDDMPLSELPVKAPAFNSEPTELERQREISSLRLKKAFGLPVDERRPALNVETILNLELEPKTKPIALPNPTFPIPGSDIVREVLALGKEGIAVTATAATATLPSQIAVLPTPSVPELIAPPPPPKELTPPPPPPPPEELMEVDERGSEEGVHGKHQNEETPTESAENQETEDGEASNLFYTPDEEDGRPGKEPSVEETESISYVPPFNNPVYPNDSFTTTYTTTIDDDARYEGRNPSPPPDLGTTFSDDP